MIDLGRRMEMILNGAGIAEANRARSAAAEARAAAEAKTATSVAPIALQAEAAPVADLAEAVVVPDPAAERQSLLRLAYIAGLGVLTGPQFASVEARLSAAQIEVPNGAGYGLGLAV